MSSSSFGRSISERDMGRLGVCAERYQAVLSMRWVSSVPHIYSIPHKHRKQQFFLLSLIVHHIVLYIPSPGMLPVW